ncbi:MAG: GNAT family N-acetyltransferase [Candidatus Kaistia colombiensis]|nr:MAG: GNAT family N-acetyltransferase [Kaistia sp.]
MSSRLFTINAVSGDRDLRDAVTLIRAYAAALPIDLAYQDFEAEIAAMPGKYAPPEGTLLLARGADGAALGCVGLRPLPGGGDSEMKRLYVAPTGRGLGVGRALVATVIGMARQLGYQRLLLDTLPSMPAAIALYRQAGFATIPPYYETPVAGTCFMALTLR